MTKRPFERLMKNLLQVFPMLVRMNFGVHQPQNSADGPDFAV